MKMTVRTCEVTKCSEVTQHSTKGYMGEKAAPYLAILSTNPEMMNEKHLIAALRQNSQSFPTADVSRVQIQQIVNNNKSQGNSIA